MTALLKAIFWPAVAALAWTQIGYGALVVALTRRGSRPGAPLATAPSAGTKAEASLPTVTLIIAAHHEASVIAAKVANARGLDYPGDRLEVIVAADGCTDDTVARATEAGADAV